MEEEFKRLESEEGGWIKHYTMLFKKSRKFSFEAGEIASNLSRNRYIDVKPYDRSRIKLSRAKDTDYINANLVTVHKAARQYILTQGPLPDTLEHFWLMVWEQKSNVIVMLNRILEMEEFVKCEQYWPDSVGAKVHYRNVNLTVTLKSVETMKHFTIRKMTLEDNETERSRTVTQFHSTAWPDHDQPESPSSVLRLLAAIRKSGGLDKMDEPTIVHCSAGIGRSGTFCLIDSVLTMVENQGSTEGIDIINTLIEMRDYRMGLIQSPVQLRFAYMAIIYGIKILEKANLLHPHISSIKDNTAADSTSSQHKANGSSSVARKPRSRNRRKNMTSTNSNSLNIFKKQMLVEALDATDSDSADSLFYDAMKPWPCMKKPRNSSPDDPDGDGSKLTNLMNNRSPNVQQTNLADGKKTAATKVQMLSNAINSLLTENAISTNTVTSTNSSASKSSVSSNVDSVLIRRHERELRNQRLAEKTNDMVQRMKADQLRKEKLARRMSFLKKSALYSGVAALVLSSVAYIYLYGTS